jgi:Ca-activated chloride channel family protein
MRRWTLLGLAGLLLTLCSGAHAQDGARVFLVLDASGSMWGKVGNQTKIEAARETVRTLLKDWKPQDELGLVAYGHRRKGDCADIEVLKPVGKVDAAAVAKQVGAITPLGMTPMSAAVRMAAEQLKTSEGPVSVILVSDGVETCKADPCAVAAELKKANVKLVVHTVGFDIQDRQAQRQLECMAHETGGLSLSASNATDLLKSLNQMIETARKKATPPAPPPPAAPKVEPKPAWTLEGSARLAENDDPLVGKDAIAWTVHKAAPAGVDPDYIGTSYKNRIEMDLPPGEYDVEAHAGSVKLKTRVKIEAGKMNRLDVVLNAGRLGLRAKRTADQTQKGDVFWEVISKPDDEQVFNSYDAETSTIVPAGKYTVKMELGAARGEREAAVPAGGTTAVEIIAGVARFEGKIVFAKGGQPVRDPFLEIFAGSDPVDNEQSVAHTYSNDFSFDLAAGAYRMRVQTDAVDRTFVFGVEPGKPTETEFSLEAGIVAFEAPRRVTTIDIKGIEKGIYGDRKDITSLTPPIAGFALPEGKYVAVVEGKPDVEFEIEPGKRTVVRIP